MASKDFETSSLGWQVQQLQQRVQEWIEFNLAIALKKAVDIGIGFPDWLYDVLVWVAWIILSLAVAWLGLILFRLIRNYWLTSSHQILNWGMVNPQPQIIPIYSVDQWLKQARKYQLEGNYAEACRALYMGMLQLLSDRQIIPQQYSLTDGEYRNLVANLASSDHYQVLLSTHEQLCFSDRPISSEVFNHCQSAYERISQQVNAP
ncbi:hypothetical protein Syn7502_00652 [Synechococcus sp. PCC 7502]|uniref:DUF4129 domain-containing protein n=1 Tax=Synechococcus sp. PCC 7502 TaxID=1173263 RepID=UPI00029FEED5|nr:DUF4129 domain-containing protein [Synechococcus sp. PCC 7502]AFY72800.1 hypothetical protein Syn7502_00652 [Synechococcus sp. PCC 7502]